MIFLKAAPLNVDDYSATLEYNVRKFDNEATRLVHEVMSGNEFETQVKVSYPIMLNEQDGSIFATNFLMMVATTRFTKDKNIYVSDGMFAINVTSIMTESIRLVNQLTAMRIARQASAQA